MSIALVLVADALGSKLRDRRFLDTQLVLRAKADSFVQKDQNMEKGSDVRHVLGLSPRFISPGDKRSSTGSKGKLRNAARRS